LIISGWKQKEHIDIYTYRRIYCGDGNLPRAYGLPKKQAELSTKDHRFYYQ